MEMERERERERERETSSKKPKITQVKKLNIGFGDLKLNASEKCLCKLVIGMSLLVTMDVKFGDSIDNSVETV